MCALPATHSRARALAPDLDFVEAARLGWTSEHEHTLRDMTEGIKLALRIAGEIEGWSDQFRVDGV
jgi:hypothetical protein